MPSLLFLMFFFILAYEEKKSFDDVSRFKSPKKYRCDNAHWCTNFACCVVVVVVELTKMCVGDVEGGAAWAKKKCGDL